MSNQQNGKKQPMVEGKVPETTEKVTPRAHVAEDEAVPRKAPKAEIASKEDLVVRFKKIHPNAKEPKFALSEDVGADLFCVEDVTIKANGRELVHTGLVMEIPRGYEGQIRPKSGLALNKGLTVLNTPGTIEDTYRGEVCVILLNTSSKVVTIEAGSKIAQFVLKKREYFSFKEVEDVSTDTERGTGGFGSTGEK